MFNSLSDAEIRGSKQLQATYSFLYGSFFEGLVLRDEQSKFYYLNDIYQFVESFFQNNSLNYSITLLDNIQNVQFITIVEEVVLQDKLSQEPWLYLPSLSAGSDISGSLYNLDNQYVQKNIDTATTQTTQTTISFPETQPEWSFYLKFKGRDRGQSLLQSDQQIYNTSIMDVSGLVVIPNNSLDHSSVDTTYLQILDICSNHLHVKNNTINTRISVGIENDIGQIPISRFIELVNNQSTIQDLSLNIVFNQDSKLLSITNNHPSQAVEIDFLDLSENLPVGNTTKTTTKDYITNMSLLSLGSPKDTVNNIENVGSVVIFRFQEKWDFWQRIISQNLDANTYFGFQVAMDDDWLIVKAVDVNYRHPLYQRFLIYCYRYEVGSKKVLVSSSFK